MSIQQFIQQLTPHFAGDLRADEISRTLYATDASAYQIMPLAVAFPHSADDIAALVSLAAEHNLPILARGAGTSLAGQAVGQAVILDCSRYLNRIIEIDPQAGTVTAQAGVVAEALNTALKPHNLHLGTLPASASRATLGGMVGNNATGAHAVRYGSTVDHLLAAEVILANGQALTLNANTYHPYVNQSFVLAEKYAAAIRSAYPKTWRRASGYSLNYLLRRNATHSQPSGWSQAKLAYTKSTVYPPGPPNPARLLAGSEGTLAVLTTVTFGLAHRPAYTGLAVLHYDDIITACEAVPTILAHQPSAVELIDQHLIRLTRSVPGYARLLTWLQGDPAAVLVVEFSGESPAQIVSQFDRLAARLGHDFTRALTPELQANVWAVRKVGLGLLQSQPGDSKPREFIEDVAVPVEVLGEYVRRLQAIFAEFDVSAAYYAHAGTGCLHIRPQLSFRSAEDRQKLNQIMQAVFTEVKRLGGALSGEHGDGLLRTAYNRALFGEQVYRAFEEIKAIWDPAHLLNPGKVVGTPAKLANLRYTPDDQPLDLPSSPLSFAAQGGFIGLVEQCNGSGECRQAGGVMCPSFQATREEEHSTRGRANLLRAALSGRLSASTLTSPRLHAALDLCLECKACKTECPSQVDMTKLKTAFLHNYHKAHGVPLRARLFANLPRLAALAQPIAPMVNALTSSGVGRWLQTRLGIAAERQLPPFARRGWRQQFSGPRLRQPDATLEKPVVVFVDTFTQNHQPQVGLAALKLLQAAGYTPVLVPQQGCCGRTFISKGLLKQAKAHAERNLRALAPFAQAGWPIVGLEPSCILTLVDEYPDFFPNDPRASAIARHTELFDQFFSRTAALDSLRFAPRRVLVHGHCYQKALIGMAPTTQLLQRPGWQVQLINAGCCGLAGSFGYEAEHYDLSRTIAHDRLMPAVQQAGPDTLLIAAGISCRQQIDHFVPRSVYHPLEVLAEALVSN